MEGDKICVRSSNNVFARSMWILTRPRLDPTSSAKNLYQSLVRPVSFARAPLASVISHCLPIRHFGISVRSPSSTLHESTLKKLPPPPNKIFPGVSTRSVPRFEVTADARRRRRARVAAPPPPTLAIGDRCFPPPFPTVSRPPARSRARPRAPHRHQRIPRARRVGFRCRTCGRRVRARSRVALRDSDASFDASVLCARSIAERGGGREPSEAREASPSVASPRAPCG